MALGIALGIPWGYASRRPWDPSQIPGIMHWWDSTDIADGVAAPAGNWTDRIASAVSTQVTPFWRDGESWNGARCLRGVATGSALQYVPAGAWTMPGADVTIIHACRPTADASGGAQWCCLASGTNGICHTQWGIRGASINPRSPGTDQWNKSNGGALVENEMLTGMGWGYRYLTAFRALPLTSGNYPSEARAIVQGGALYSSARAVGYSGTYSSTQPGRIVGSALGTQCGLVGALRAIVVVAGQVSPANLTKLANYFGVP